MQFVSRGPDIPDALLQAHEEGRKVFFCGAGISYPAGLPGFGGLVEKIYQLNREEPTEIETEAIKRDKFDATLDLLERRLQGQRLAVRRALEKALEPNLSLNGAIDTHSSLLRLARTRDRALRLVTTNFDRIFHAAAKSEGLDLNIFTAPFLPIPKNSRWNGLVFLHGLLPETADDTALNRLVLTSGDFGLAYLTERWAARFVSELFRNYVVCFVGYSINDPVLRYMMDALAADRMLGELIPQAWAIGESAPGNERGKTVEWEAKGVTPILYQVPAGTHNHSALHETLHAWAATYRDGVIGKERVVVSHALAHPSASTRQDDFVGRMLWALSDQSGLPAKQFADFNPAPSLDWLLYAFCDKRFEHYDLTRFGVSPQDKEDSTLRFSLICRPSSYVRSPPMQLVSNGVASSEWDHVMIELARWLTRHLNDPRLIVWISRMGGALHDRLSRLIENQLERLAALERDGKSDQLNEIQLHAPNALPSTMMTTLWRLLIAGRIKSARTELDLFRWRGQLQREGLTTTLKCELRRLLTPQLMLKESTPLRERPPTGGDAKQLRELFDWDLRLVADDVNAAIGVLSGDHWSRALPALLDDFQQLLTDALDLLREIGEADDHNDPSRLLLQSISPHQQNRGRRNWVCLIELVRDAWLSVLRSDNARATWIAQNWFCLPYPTFKRLALFAASQNESIAPQMWVEWLIADEGWSLWSDCTKREALRLLVLQGSRLVGDPRNLLEAAILAGPPHAMQQTDMEANDAQYSTESAVWLRLAKLSASGISLGTPAATRLKDLTAACPERQLAPNDSDEFLFWMSFSGEPDYESGRSIDAAPRTRRELVRWLKKTPTTPGPFHEDTWPDVCRTRFFHTTFALCDLAADGEWPISRWRDALQAWGDKELVTRSWRYAATLVERMPVEILGELAHSVTWWIEKASNACDQHQEILLGLCKRCLHIPLEASSGMTRGRAPLDEPLFEAINHPVGHITQALINCVYKRSPNDNELLPAVIKAMLTSLCDCGIDRFRHGRVLLGSQVISLFRVDRNWTEDHLLQLFDWNNPTVATTVWVGFLWSPRLFPPLLIALKTDFLACSRHYDELGEQRRQFAALLTYAALGPTEGFSTEDFRTAIRSLPPQGLEECSLALAQAIEGAGDKCEEYWKNRVLPFWSDVWPRSCNLATPQIAESLIRVVIAARGEFSAAWVFLQDWITPVPDLDYVVPILQESGMCSRFPSESLQLLHAAIENQQWVSVDLGKCLKEIARMEPSFEHDDRHQRLVKFARMHDAYD